MFTPLVSTLDWGVEPFITFNVIGWVERRPSAVSIVTGGICTTPSILGVKESFQVMLEVTFPLVIVVLVTCCCEWIKKCCFKAETVRASLGEVSLRVRFREKLSLKDTCVLLTLAVNSAASRETAVAKLRKSAAKMIKK